MIVYYGTIIQFFAAIYITLSFDNILFRNIWSLNYVQIIQERMRVLFSDNGSLFDNKIKKTIEETSSTLEKQSRLRGFVCLFFSVFTLWYIGDEQTVTKADITLYHLPYTLLLIATTITFFIVMFWVRRLLYVAFLCAGALLVYVVAWNSDVSFLLRYDYISFVNTNVDKIVPIALFLPLLLQLVVSWLYSDNYYYILGGKIVKEYTLYSRALKAKTTNEMPDEYNRAIKNTYYDQQKDSSQDTKVTNIVKELCNRLQATLSEPSMYEITRYAVKNLLGFRKDVLNEYAIQQKPQINGESLNDIQTESQKVPVDKGANESSIKHKIHNISHSNVETPHRNGKRGSKYMRNNRNKD